MSFAPGLLPRAAAVPPQTLEQLKKLEIQLHERDEKLSALPGRCDGFHAGNRKEKAAGIGKSSCSRSRSNFPRSLPNREENKLTL